MQYYMRDNRDIYEREVLCEIKLEMLILNLLIWPNFQSSQLMDAIDIS